MDNNKKNKIKQSDINRKERNRFDATPYDDVHRTLLTDCKELILPVIKVQAYSVDEIFEKKLYYLIPFYMFTYEKEFWMYNEDTDRLADLKEEYRKIMSRLQRCCEEGLLEEYTMQTIIDMSKKVLSNIAADYSHIKEEVRSVMGGKVLNYRTKRIYNRGVSQGIAQGITQGALQSRIDVFLKALSKGMTLSEAQDLVDIDDATVKIALEKSQGSQE